MDTAELTLDDLLLDHPAATVDNRQFLVHCVNRKHHQRNNLDRWNYLYRRYDAEYCEIRRRLFRKAHGRSISEVSSTDLCFCERYTACVNFGDAKDGLVRHVCDMLPIVIGSAIDLRIRRDFWLRGKPYILEDVPKIGFIIQNKNYYNFTACLTTNPKVCHIYRRNAKLHSTEVRLYFYDHNFRGNKLYLKQCLVLEKCDYCHESRSSGPGTVGGVPADGGWSASRCRLRLYVAETLMLRNCYKHDYVFLSRRCNRAETHQSVRDTVAWLCGYKGSSAAVPGDQSSSSSSSSSSSAYRRPTCRDVFSHGGSSRVLRVQCSKNACSFVLCDCSSMLLMHEYVNLTAGSGRRSSPSSPSWLSSAPAAASSSSSSSSASSSSAADESWGAAPRPDDGELTFENVDKMIELNDSCFVDSAAKDRDASAVIEKMFTLFIYMHEVLIRNEDIDLLCNKCIFEGPILYGLLMQQLGSYLCEKYSIAALFTDVVDTLVSKMREFSHTGNLYMLISRKTNIRVDLTNDMKRLLKTSVKREKNHNIDVCSNLKTFTVAPSSSAGATAASSVAAPSVGSLGVSTLSDDDGVAGGGVAAANAAASLSTTTVHGSSANRPEDATSVAALQVAIDAANRLRACSSDGVEPAESSTTADPSRSKCAPAATVGGSSASNTILDTFAANSNSDFLLRRKRQKRSVMFDAEAVRRLLHDEDRDDDDDDDVENYEDGDDKGAPAATTVGGPSTAANKTFYTGMDPFRGQRVLILYSSVRDYNSRQLLNYGNLQYLLQGISAPHYTDTEFIAEQIKRPRITNQQNSSKCARIPREFQQFVSFYNIGNLSTAGRCMNLAARTRLSFFVHPVVQVAEHYFRWFLSVYYDDSLFHHSPPLRVSPLHCVAHEVLRCARCFLFLIINEVPYCNVLVDRYFEFQLFLLSKIRWPAVQFYRKSNVVLSVSIQSGIIMIPVCLPNRPPVPPQTSPSPHRWRWCAACRLYFPTDDRFTSTVFQLTYPLLYTYHRFVGGGGCSSTVDDGPRPADRSSVSDRFLDGMLNICPHHVWFSPNDLTYYRGYARTYFSAAATTRTPLYYEIACHGAFSCARNLASVDISKTIVSINAAKRRLRLGSELADRLSVRSPFESLMDQNARILVYTDVSGWRDAVLPSAVTPAIASGGDADAPRGRDRDFMALRDPRNEPLHDIVAVPGRNTFFCCFAFGDYEGFNCEDAYVFHERFRPLVENVIELKVNYYKFDRSVIRTNRVQLKFDPSVHLNAGCGCTVKLGMIRSYYKLSFGSTMITVNMSRVRNLYHYTLSYTSNAAYLRRGARVFEDLPDGSRGLDFLDPEVHISRYNDDEYARHNSKSNVVMLYDATAHTRNRNIVIGAQVSTRQLRFRLSLKNVRTTQKIQNNCGQKGMPVYRDLGDLYTDRGGSVHLIVSSYSLLGRQPLAQLLEQRSMGGCDERFSPMLRVYSRKANGRQVGWAGYGEFFFSCDSPHDNIIVSGPNCGNNPMRVCNLTYYAAIDSGLSTAIFNRISDHENYKNNPANGVPLNIYKLLSVYRYFNRDIDFKEFAARKAREQLRDWINVSALGVHAELPAYLRRLVVAEGGMDG